MAIKHGSKVDKSFSASSMTDLMFLLLLFLLIATTLINPNALKLMLHCDETVAVGETVKVMNIAKDNNYKLILATAPN